MQFAAKRIAFCRKLLCVLPQITLCFAAKCAVFCRKIAGHFAAKRRDILPQNGLCVFDLHVKVGFAGVFYFC
jgi:hypothetical protein